MEKSKSLSVLLGTISFFKACDGDLIFEEDQTSTSLPVCKLFALMMKIIDGHKD